MSILLLSLCLSCSQPAAQQASRQEIEQFIATSLPNDAADLHVAQEAGIDTLMYLRFSAAPASIQDFVRALQPTIPLKANYDPFPAAAKSELEWWQPMAAQQSAGTSYISTTGKAYEILLDQTNPQQWHVYLRVYTL